MLKEGVTPDKISFNKLHARSTGPYKILKKINIDAYVIDLPSNFGIILTFNILDLVTYKSLPFNMIIHL